jgi:ubiquinone/menaquinone biosynthesis C-methylase UbiE
MTAQSPGPGHRWFAAMYDATMRANERRFLAPARRRLLSDLSGDVVEIGAGTGANFEHYRQAARVAAFEPDAYMMRRAEEKLATLGAHNIMLRQAPGESLPVSDGSCDVVVSTLVLCTVRDVARTLAEIRRVLRPGGELRFVEHIRAEGALGIFQDAVRPVWSWFGAGCNPNRRTGDAIAGAGFDLAAVERQKLMLGVPVIHGVAPLRI